MKVTLAKSAGFCGGVRRAVDLTLAASSAKEGKISTYGPLVHNPQVIELLRLREVECAKEISELTDGLAVIRSHGVPPQDKQAIADKGLHILDATCPKVLRVQGLVGKYAEQGCHVVIVGEPDHPEVKGLRGYGEKNCTVIQSANEIDALPRFEKVCLLAQTTQNKEGFAAIEEKLRAIYPDLQVENTICNATRKRQDEVRALAAEVDAMIVIGGRDSGNTRRLVDIAEKECNKPTFWIETERELSEKELAPFDHIGVTAGASTPSWVIDRVMLRLSEMDTRRKSPVLARLKALVDIAVITSVYTSLAAGALCYVGSVLLGIPFQLRIFALVFSYVLAMHVLNRVTESGTDTFRDDPIRQQFYKRHAKGMMALGIGAAISAGLLSIQVNAWTFLLVLVALIFGVLYSVRVVPKGIFKRLGFRRLKDIAASKNFFVASAWAVVSIFPLFFIEHTRDYFRLGAAFVFLFLITGIRSIYMDLSDIASDRLVGRDSVPIVFGEKRTHLLIRMLVVALFFLCYTLAFFKVIPSIGYLIGFWILGEYLLLTIFKPKLMSRRSLIARDLIVDGHFILAGIAAWIWKVI